MTKLKQLRTEKGLQQKFVAGVLGITPQKYGQYELGVFTPNLEMSCRIAEFYGITQISDLKNLFKNI